MLTEILLACIPTAVTGFCFWLLEEKISKQGKKREKEEQEHERAAKAQEKNRKRQELLFAQGISASIMLGTATAKAVERIPDTHCNGDMHEALDYAAKVKREQDDFLAEQGIENIYEKG